jgi:hypothetical protein
MIQFSARRFLCCALIATILFAAVVQATSHVNDDDSNANNLQVSLDTRQAIAQAASQFQALPISRLRRFIGDRGADCEGCFEKRDLVERAVQVMRWPTRDDAIAAELSLDQDLSGPLYLEMPVGDDRSPILDINAHESLSESPTARPSLQPLTDDEVVALLELYRMRVLVQEGVARCGPRLLNGTQYCSPANAIITRETE